MKNLLKVQGHTNYYRDPSSKAIIIDDKEKLNLYENQKRTIEFNAKNMNHINNEVISLKQDVDNLRSKIDIIIDILKNKGS